MVESPLIARELLIKAISPHVCSARLTWLEQWQAELAEKFHIEVCSCLLDRAGWSVAC